MPTGINNLQHQRLFSDISAKHTKMMHAWTSVNPDAEMFAGNIYVYIQLQIINHKVYRD